MKQKRCVICKQTYEPRATFQRTCSIPCAMALVEQKKAKKAKRDKILERKQTRAQLLDLKPLSYWADKLQYVVNQIVRERDAKDPCISCGTTKAKVWHAGHFYSRKARPELRYHLDNIHKQCSQCNTHESANIHKYRPRLIEKIGQEAFDELSGPHEPLRWRREDYEREIARCRAVLKEMKEKE